MLTISRPARALGASFLALLLCSGATLLADETCPEGTAQSGSAPPTSLEQGCSRGSVRHGPWTSFWPNGAKWREGAYDDGKRMGAWTASAPNGKPLYTMEYEGGFANGKAVTYWPSGQKKAEGELGYGKLNGTWRAWREDGSEVGQLVFDAGKVRPRSVGNAKVAAFLPSSVRPDALAKARKRVASLRAVAKALLALGGAAVPAKLSGEKAEAYEAQSKWLLDTASQLALHADAIGNLDAELQSGSRTGLIEEIRALRKARNGAVKKARAGGDAFKASSAACSARHAMAMTEIVKLVGAKK